MKSLRDQMRVCCQGRLCLAGVGQIQSGDDGFGVRLVEALARHDRSHAVVEKAATFRTGPERAVTLLVAGCSPERHAQRLADLCFDHVVFADATNFGGTAGSVVMLSASEALTRLPQVSTHRLSLGLLAKMLEANGRTRAWVLGAQPHSLQTGTELSPILQRTTEALADLWAEELGWGRPAIDSGRLAMGTRATPCDARVILEEAAC